MATSGSITTNSCESRSLTLSWSLSSQSVSGNYSNVSWTLKGTGSASGYVKSGNFQAIINGTTVYSSSTRIELRNGTVVASGSIQIPHNSDGTKSFSMSCQAGIYYNAVNCTASGSFTLTTIPRASSVSMPSATMGSAATITISRASSSFTHTLTYAFGNATGTIVSKTSSTSVSWTPPLTLANQVPSAVSGTGTITCTTYNGSTSIGTKTCTLTLSVPSSVKPTMTSLTATRVDETVPSSWGIYVQSKSKATLTINGAAGSYGSTISSYSITGGGYSGTSSTLTTGLLNSSGAITFTAKVTDSRGRTSDEATVTISVVSYTPPSFSSYSSQRCLSGGTLDDEGTYIKGTVAYSYALCSSKNTLTRSTYYKKTTDSTWIDASASFSSGTAFVFGGGNLSTDYSYDIKYTITDAFTSISVYDVVTTAAVVMDFKAGGRGVSVGKVSEYDDTFEVSEKWDVRVYGKLLKEFVMENLYPVGSIYLSVNSTNPGTLFGGTWVQLQDRFLLGAGSTYSNGATGGAATVTLTTSQMPSHTHTFTGSSATTSSAGAHTHNVGRDYDGGGGSSRYTVHSSGVSGAGGTSPTNSAGAHTHTLTAKGSNSSTGGGGSHNNMPPYLVVYMWKRTA